MIPVYSPRKATNQQNYVLDCLEGNWLSYRGKYVKSLEEELCKYLNVEHVVLTTSGSTALSLVLAGLSIGPGDEVIVPSLTYAATVSSVHWSGATPVLVNSDDHLQILINDIATSSSGKARAVLVPELYGDMPNMDLLLEVCEEKNLLLVEDSAEAFGCSFNGKMAGSFGIASTFSFFTNKIITGGELGCVATNDSSLAKRLRHLRNQAHTGNFVHSEPGFNYRPSNISAAICLAHLEEIDFTVARKKEIAEFYRSNLPREIRRITPQVESSEWMPLFELPDAIPYPRFSQEMNAHNIETRPCFTPVHLMEGWDYETRVSLEGVESGYRKRFNLPSYPDLSNKDLDYICDMVDTILNKEF
jgi:perosamine synthetase